LTIYQFDINDLANRFWNHDFSISLQAASQSDVYTNPKLPHIHFEIANIGHLDLEHDMRLGEGGSAAIFARIHKVLSLNGTCFDGCFFDNSWGCWRFGG
jgi:hypothetical protein